MEERKEGRNGDKWALIGQSREMKSTEACKTDSSDEAKRNSSREKKEKIENSSLTGLEKKQKSD